MRVSEVRLLREQYLKEGGASGHLMHLYDNTDMTFGEMKEIILAAAEGRLERVSEKLDGLNLVFTYADGLKVARSGSDIKAGGMDAAGLASKFYGRNNVETAFNAAFAVLRDSMSALPDDVRDSIFNGGRTWYSIEVIFTQNPNVINYDNDCIVFHESPVFNVNDDGTINKLANSEGVEILARHIDQMQAAITQRSWQVRGPAIMQMKRLNDGSVAQRAINAIHRAQNAGGGVGDDATIGDYMFNVVSEEVADLGLGYDVTVAVTNRIIGAPGAPGLPQIRKMVSKEDYPRVSEFVKASGALMKRAILPIEQAIHDFAIEVLRGMQSVLVSNTDAEIARLRQQVTSAVNAIGSSGNIEAMDTLARHMQKLGNVGNIASAMEGIVFIWKGNAYKFTGAFAPMNQILGLFRYGRGGVKLSSESPLKGPIDLLIEHCMA